MKRKIKIVVVICLLSTSISLVAQENSSETIKKTDIQDSSDEKSSSIFRFEPDYLTSVENERAQQRKNREILDTLSISERKKKRLLKKVFKNDFSEYLSKTTVVDTKFEDVE